MISITKYLFEIGPGAVNMLSNYINRQKQDPNRAPGIVARATDLKGAAEAKVNASGESKLEGKAMNFLGMRSGKQLAGQRWSQYKTNYRGR